MQYVLMFQRRYGKIKQSQVIIVMSGLTNVSTTETKIAIKSEEVTHNEDITNITFKTFDLERVLKYGVPLLASGGKVCHLLIKVVKEVPTGI